MSTTEILSNMLQKVHGNEQLKYRHSKLSDLIWETNSNMHI